MSRTATMALSRLTTILSIMNISNYIKLAKCNYIIYNYVVWHGINNARYI